MFQLCAFQAGIRTYIRITIPGVWNGKLLFHSTLNIPGQSGFPVVWNWKWKVCFPFHTSSVEFQGNVAFLFTYTVLWYSISQVKEVLYRKNCAVILIVRIVQLNLLHTISISHTDIMRNNFYHVTQSALCMCGCYPQYGLVLAQEWLF